MRLDFKEFTPILGVLSPLMAQVAEKAGAKALYLSGAGVSNFHFGMPDLGLTNSTDVVRVVEQICAKTSLPLLVDADTGFGGPLNVARTTADFVRAGAAGLHLEDQTFNKRCGHRDGKKLISTDEMCDKIASARASAPKDFMIMARTDALAVEGHDGAMDRANKYLAAGADSLFIEAVGKLDQIQPFTSLAPTLINCTEFGKTPLYSFSELKEINIRYALYPLGAMRMLLKATENFYKAVLSDKQADCIDEMLTRDELYDLLDYEKAEQSIKEKA